jgi:predicted permease
MNGLKQLFSRRRLYAELSDEIREHLEEEIEGLVAAGMSRKEAGAAARRQFGNVTLVEEDSRAVWQWPSIESFLMDLRYGLRELRKNPGFTVVAVLTLALGIGVNTSVFSLSNFLLMRPLAVPEAERVTVVSRGGHPFFSFPDYRDYQDRNQSFTALAASLPTESSLDYEGEGRAIAAEAVAASYSAVMQVQPLLGRWFADENENVAVISYDAWQRMFRGDRGVLGKHVRSESQWYTVIGVAPPDFTGIYAPIRTDIWVPLRIWRSQYPNFAAEVKDRARPRVMIFGRLKPGVEPLQAAANLNAIDRQIQNENPGMQRAPAQVRVERVQGVTSPVSRRGAAPVLILLFAVVGAVLLIACVNVGNLLLARGASRQHELVVRAALGADRMRLLRQLLTESFVLCLLGTAAGLLTGHWTNRILEVLLLSLPIDAPIQLNLSFDHRVFLFAAALAVVATIACGLLPAWQATRVGVAPALKRESPATKRFRLRHALLVAQVTLSLALLLCAGLFLRSMARMRGSDPGFAVHNHLYALTYISQPEFNDQSGRAFYGRVLEDLRNLPGVRSASLTRLLPLRGEGNDSDCVSAGEADPFPSSFGVIDSGFLATMHIPLAEGREFNALDRPEGRPIAIVNATLARRLWPDRSPVGQVLRVGCKTRSDMEVVGVARDSKVVSLGEPAGPHFYLPYSQNYTGLVTLVLETAMEPKTMVNEVRLLLHRESKSVRIYALESLASHLERSYYQVRWESSMLAIFGIVALALATVGLYGSIAYHVTRRTHEIGVRMALGAGPGEILRLVLRQGLRLTLTGIVIGLAMSLALARLLARFLSGLSPNDPITFGLTAMLWICVAVLACYVPARRAMRVDPMVALRHE